MFKWFVNTNLKSPESFLICLLSIAAKFEIVKRRVASIFKSHFSLLAPFLSRKRNDAFDFFRFSPGVSQLPVSRWNRGKGKRHGRLIQKPNSCHYFKFDHSGANRFLKCPSHICSVNKASTPIKCQYSSGMFGDNRSIMWDDSAADGSGFKFSGNPRRGSFLGFREDIYNNTNGRCSCFHWSPCDDQRRALYCH